MCEILVTGGTGQVGSELAAWPWPDDVRVVCPPRAELDLADPASVTDWVATRRPDLVINSGAYTAVDRAESDVVTAWKVNALAPAALAAATAANGVPILQVSTDYVFDGSRSEPREPNDPVGPLGVYGASKEAGEQAVRTANSRHVILRTAWVAGAEGANFVKTMLRLGAERPLLRIVDDQLGCPTSAADLADALARIALRHLYDETAPTGTHHFVNAGHTTWYGLAEEVFARAARGGRTVPTLEPISTTAYPTPAKRPRSSRLSTRTLEETFGIAPRPWREAIGDVLTKLGL